jgi:excisionase family DNA binding protein
LKRTQKKLFGGKRMLLNIKQTAGKLGISEVTLRRLIRLKRIPYWKIGSVYRFADEDITQFVTSVWVSSTYEAASCERQ